MSLSKFIHFSAIPQADTSYHDERILCFHLLHHVFTESPAFKLVISSIMHLKKNEEWTARWNYMRCHLYSLYVYYLKLAAQNIAPLQRYILCKYLANSSKTLLLAAHAYILIYRKYNVLTKSLFCGIYNKKTFIQWTNIPLHKIFPYHSTKYFHSVVCVTHGRMVFICHWSECMMHHIEIKHASAHFVYNMREWFIQPKFLGSMFC